MENTKYGTRQFLNDIIAGNATPEAQEMARTLLERLDAKNEKRRNTPSQAQVANEFLRQMIHNYSVCNNEKRRNTPSKAQVANEPLRQQVFAYVAQHPSALASEVATACELSSTAKASTLLRQLVAEGECTVEEVKIKGKGKLKAYTAVTKAE